MNNGKPVYVTQEGLEKMKAELDRLVNEKRPALAERLHFAIKQGDLSENADYIQAKEEQGFLEGRIRDLQEKIHHAEVIAESEGPQERAVLGTHVTVKENGFEPETYHLVGSTEADPSAGKISHESPLGRALLGREVGDVVHVKAPAGTLEFKIVDIS